MSYTPLTPVNQDKQWLLRLDRSASRDRDRSIRVGSQPTPRQTKRFEIIDLFSGLESHLMWLMTGKIGTSTAHWFARGLTGGLLLMAGVNAVSFFFRSGGFGSLLGYPPSPTESIGFPLEVWSDQRYYDGAFVDYRAVLGNTLFALIPGVCFGLVGVCGRRQFNQWVHEFEQQEANSGALRLQFSTKTLLVLTTLAAVILATLSTWRESRVTLLAIYVLGPATLIALAMMPDQVRWYWRALLLVIVAKGMIGIAIWTGVALGIPFDKVMFGIFVSWVPQSIFAAFAITVWLIIQPWWRVAPPKQ